jgi:hypothetical protein
MVSTKTLRSKDIKIISAKEAALAAKEFYEGITDVEPSRISLEEISLGESKNNWFVTLGIYTSTDNPILLAQGLKELLAYKAFKIDAKTGQVISMDIKFINYPKPQNG